MDVMLNKLKQFAKALSPILLPFDRNSRVVSPLQPEKALLPMLVTFEGIVTLLSALQSEKAYSPMENTP